MKKTILFLILLHAFSASAADETKKNTSVSPTSSNSSSSFGIFETIGQEPVNNRMHINIANSIYPGALAALTALKQLNPTTAVTVIQQFVHTLPSEEQLQVGYGAIRILLVDEESKRSNPQFESGRTIYDLKQLAQKEQEHTAAIFLLTKASLEAHEDAKRIKTRDGQLPTTPTRKKRSCVIS